MTRSLRLIGALWLVLAGGPALAQAPLPPVEQPSGTVFFPGILVRPDGRPAHLNEVAPEEGGAGPAETGAKDAAGTRGGPERRRPPRR